MSALISAASQKMDRNTKLGAPLAGFYLLGGGGKLPPNVSASPPQKKKVFWRKIQSYFKYWFYLTTILRNQWRLLMSRNAIQPILNTIFSKISGGARSRTPLEGRKTLFSPLRGSKNFFRIDSPQQRILDRTLLGDNQNPLAEKPTWLVQIKGDPILLDR